jgi:hypothetical protein
MSIGRANKPTPPNRTTNIQPKKERMAIIYTANDVSNSIVSFVSTAEIILIFDPSEFAWTCVALRVIERYGRSTYLKNAHEINKIRIEITIAPNVYPIAVNSLLHIVYY